MSIIVVCTLHNIWQVAVSRTQIPVTAAKCATHELHTSLVSRGYATFLHFNLRLSDTQLCLNFWSHIILT